TKYIDCRAGSDKITAPAGVADGTGDFTVTEAGAGTYDITLTLDELGEVVSIVITASAAA
ncbi:MAG: hypothetical protein K2L88_06740, partial [Clostridiales bacterium]|nr:hypothetical protein [Clostridiales bacterium]